MSRDALRKQIDELRFGISFTLKMMATRRKQLAEDKRNLAQWRTELRELKRQARGEQA